MEWAAALGRYLRRDAQEQTTQVQIADVKFVPTAVSIHTYIHTYIHSDIGVCFCGAPIIGADLAAM